jgi:hypothetical protein
MRKVKSTALLGAFVAVASVGVISHEAHGAAVGAGSLIYNIPKEMLPGAVLSLSSVSLSTSANYQNGASVTLTLSGATFVNSDYYGILGPGSYSGCFYNSSNQYSGGPSPVPSSGLNSLTLSCANNGTGNYSLTAGASYTIVGGPNSTLENDASIFSVSVPQNSSPIVLQYIPNVNGDSAASATLANVVPQLSVSSSITTAVISPSSGTVFTDNSPSATNTVVISNSAYNDTNVWTNTISSLMAGTSYTMNFLFTNIPSSVSALGAIDSNNPANSSITAPVNGSVTLSLPLAQRTFILSSGSSDTITFSFTNSGNIQLGTILLSSITGIGLNNSNSSVSYVYSSTTQPFITFSSSGVQIYIPDALAKYDGNLIQAGFITISMPSDTSIASISVLNNPSASCPVPTIANGSLSSATSPGVYYIDLNKLANLCTGISSSAWQSGVPLVINLSGSNVSPNNITADAYAVFNNMLKRIPVVVVSNGTGLNAFSY